MPPPKGRPWIEEEWVEGDTPIIKWTLQDIRLNTDAPVSGATAVIKWYDGLEGYRLVEVADDEVTISNGEFTWSPAVDDLPAEAGHNGYHEYQGQVVITFAGGEQRT